MEWNNIKVAENFLRRANAIHPEEDSYSYAEDLARQDFYYECYMMCFTKEKLDELLVKVLGGDVKVPKGADASAYKSAYMDEAKKAKDAMANGKI
jgi:hypothetical protein